MPEMAPSDDPVPIEQLRAVVDLLDNPTLARMYAYVERSGGATVEDIVTDLDVPQGTAYDYVDRLETAGLLERTTATRPYEFDATPLSLTFSTGGETRTISAELVDAIGRRETNRDVDVFLDRHGVDGLANVLEYAREYVDGTVNHRIAARELDLSPVEAEHILQALEPIVRRHRTDG